MVPYQNVPYHQVWLYNEWLGIFFLNDRFETWSQKNQTIDLWLEIDLKN